MVETVVTIYYCCILLYDVNRDKIEKDRLS